MTDIFCKIIAKEIPADVVAESENWLAIKDIHPVTPVHVLVVPRRHGALDDYGLADQALLGELMLAVREVAHKLGIVEGGYRVIINNGPDSGGHVQDHLHIHLLAGRKLGSKIVNE